jgi:hypothetical protein
MSCRVVTAGFAAQSDGASGGGRSRGSAAAAASVAVSATAANATRQPENAGGGFDRRIDAL